MVKKDEDLEWIVEFGNMEFISDIDKNSFSGEVQVKIDLRKNGRRIIGNSLYQFFEEFYCKKSREWGGR